MFTINDKRPMYVKCSPDDSPIMHARCINKDFYLHFGGRISFEQPPGQFWLRVGELVPGLPIDLHPSKEFAAVDSRCPLPAWVVLAQSASKGLKDATTNVMVSSQLAS